jgi:DNA-binding LacI/PurR family transcriptional regulator
MKHTKGIPEVVTMREIAERAGVSLGTVSHVLNDSAAVRDVLRSRVMEAVKDLGYEPSQLARAFSRNSMDLVGMIVPDITNPFFPGVVRGAEDVAYQHGQRLVLCNTDNDASKEISYLADLRSFRSSGVLIIPSLETRVLDSIRPTDPPVVFVARCPEGWKGDFVVADNEKGGYLVARHLAQLGHRQYGVVTGPLHLNTAHARLEGFQRGLKEAGRKLIPEFIHEARYNSESGHLAAMRLLQMLPRPTAIFAANDLLAMGVLSALREMNLRCPEDVSLVGFDNLDIASYMAPALTTIHESGYEMGANACRLLLDRIKKRNAPVSRVVLPIELRVRDSTSRPFQATAATKKPAKK